MPKRKNKGSLSSKRKRRTTSTVVIVPPTIKDYLPNSLFGLPTELRLTVYGHIFHEKPQKNGEMRILLTCRQIFHEAYALAYRHMVLKIKTLAFQEEHSDWLWSFRKLSPYLRTSLRSIEFQNYDDLHTILRAGVFHPDRLLDYSRECDQVVRAIYRVLYDYACKLSSSQVSYILQGSSPTLVGRIHEATRERLNAGGEWNKRLTSGIMKRFEDIEAAPLTDGSETAFFQVNGVRLDGSEFQLTISNSYR